MRIDGTSFNQPAAPEGQDQKLREACRDFESLLVKQLLSQMRATVPKSDLFGSQEEEVYQDMLDSEMSKDIGRTGSLNIGELLYQQLSKSDASDRSDQSDKSE